MSNRKFKKIIKPEINPPDIRQFLSGKQNIDIDETIYINTCEIHQPEGEAPLMIPNVISEDDDKKFMEFFHVNELINTKHEKNKDIMKTPKLEIPKITSEKQVELCLMYKLKNNTDFFRYLNMSENGRRYINQIDSCLETLKNIIDMSSSDFKNLINDLIYKQEAGLLT